MLSFCYNSYMSHTKQIFVMGKYLIYDYFYYFKNKNQKRLTYEYNSRT